MDLRDRYIAQVVEGRSFADVGGLWGTVNEKVSVAAKHNARELAMVDVSTAESELWQLFRDRLSALGVPQCTCISGDICDLAGEAMPKYEVVHCSGVLYHHPNPLLLFESLRRVTGHHLILTSAVTQEVVTTEIGSFRIPSSGAIFIPALEAQDRAILWKYWQENAGVTVCHGISEPVKWDLRELGPWWWLFTPRVMLAMATSVGFRVLDAGPTWNGNAHTALLEVVN